MNCLIPIVLLAVAAEPEAEIPSPPIPGRFAVTIRSGKFDRVAHVQIPALREPGPTPLVLVLHGAGGNGTDVLEMDGWAAKADKAGFIAVAPDALPASTGKPASFRVNPPLRNARRSPPAAIDDVAFIRELLDELAARVPYDENRVYCAGHSNGGDMNFRLATNLSQRFAAIGMVGGFAAKQDPKPEKPLPTLYILGTNDPLMPVDGGEVETLWGKVRNPPVSKTLTAWADALDCETTPTTVSDKKGVRKVKYPSTTNGPALSVIYIEGHGHHWPGGQRTLPISMAGPITNKLNATDTLWEFFRTGGLRSE
jgi:polyhydroxybutyrate depolymerase